MTDDTLTAPVSSKGDVAHALTKAGLSAIPIIGGSAAELFQLIVQPPLERRRLAWMAEVGDKLKELAANGLDLEKLQNNENFISAVMHASQVALRTNQKEKIAALRSAIANVAKGQSPDEAVQFMFLDFIDSLSEVHFRILKLFQSPPPSPNISAGPLSSVLDCNIPQLKGRGDICDQFWKDLYSRGLLNTESLHGTMSGAGLGQKRTTSLGDLFLKFISEP